MSVFEDEEISGSAVGQCHCLFSELVPTPCEAEYPVEDCLGGLTVPERIDCFLFGSCYVSVTETATVFPGPLGSPCAITEVDTSFLGRPPFWF